MRKEENFLEQQLGDKRISVLKTYDTIFARESFDQMTPDALGTLAATLDLSGRFDSQDIPAANDDAFPEFLWEVIKDDAREDWNSFSYFVVTERLRDRTTALYVSPDWPSAEAFANATILVTA